MNVGTEMMGKTKVLSSGLHISEILPPKVVNGGLPKSAAKKRQIRYVSIFSASAAPTSKRANAVMPTLAHQHNTKLASPKCATHRQYTPDSSQQSH